MNEKIIVQLIEIIKERKKSSDKNSYVVNLFDEGKVKIANKLGEEAVETISALLSEGKQELLEESADLIFHFGEFGISEVKKHLISKGINVRMDY